jgi:hypothetical protein
MQFPTPSTHSLHFGTGENSQSPLSVKDLCLIVVVIREACLPRLVPGRCPNEIVDGVYPSPLQLQAPGSLE